MPARLAECAPSSPTAISASASSIGASVSATKHKRHFITATAMYREMDMRFWLEQAEAEMNSSA